MVCAQQNVPAKSFKVCKILCIRKFMGFPLHKILKYFNGTFCWALTSYFWWLFMYQKTVPGIIRHATSRAKIVFRKFDNNSGWAAGWAIASFFSSCCSQQQDQFFCNLLKCQVCGSILLLRVVSNCRVTFSQAKVCVLRKWFICSCILLSTILFSKGIKFSLLLHQVFDFLIEKSRYSILISEHEKKI